MCHNWSDLNNRNVWLEFCRSEFSRKQFWKPKIKVWKSQTPFEGIGEGLLQASFLVPVLW
jgi:hypothetical protein